ncbi:hypothetical protein [Rhodoblastus acidophilus]|uniref:hypothetical protein n=1 Tax=Rhodoblastus acidophilus TaxID=1074 RepID=UPI001FCECC78|nr:hypothetical protein [Rhodoblastus acidophilus]
MTLFAVVGQTYGGAKAIFHCAYDHANPEDVRFCKATPSGMAEFQIDNPSALELLLIGKSYYFDIAPVEDTPAASTA